MTAPTLLEAARDVSEWHFVHWQTHGLLPPDVYIWARLRAAIAAEEAKPKMERFNVADFVRPYWDGTDWVIQIKTADHDLKYLAPLGKQGFPLIAEYPVPAPPKGPSIEERLDKWGSDPHQTEIVKDIREAAAEIRRLKKEKP